jgi:hypothetical protein
MIICNNTKIATFYPGFSPIRLFFIFVIQLMPSYRHILLLLVLTSFLSCRKNEDEIPNVPVNIYVNTTDPNFVALNAVGGWVYITGGNRGIVVYRKSQTEFVALERTCSYKPSDGHQHQPFPAGQQLRFKIPDHRWLGAERPCLLPAPPLQHFV